MQQGLAIARPQRGVAVVTMSRPERRNAGDLAMWVGLCDAFGGFAADGVRVAILTGAGGHFCAGNDIKAYARVRHDPAAERQWMEAIRAAYDALRAAPFPVVAAIRGSCVGAGCGLAMSCDFRLAAPDARFGIPAARLGILYPAEQTRRLAAHIGIANARRWLYSGALHDADAARQDGFVDFVVEGDAVVAAIDFAHIFVANAPLSVAGAKRQLNALADGTLDTEMDALARLYDEAEASDDHAEAERAFAEKRPPRFTGR
jgi:enoyl-CoA hydratase/carnithine racemase